MTELGDAVAAATGGGKVDHGGTALERLRAPFEPGQVRRRPEVTCLACKQGNCVEHEQRVCEGCHQLVSTRHEHVEYVSHTEVTDRLLDVDPYWYWEPFAKTPEGLPALDGNGGLWICLYVHVYVPESFRPTQVSRIGYGDPYSQEKPGDAVKAAISDALKNAAGRFGVGLELAGPRPYREVVPGQPGVPALADDDPLSALVQTIRTLSGYANRHSNAEIAQHYAAVNADHPDPACRSINTATAQALMGYIAALSGGLVGQVEGGAAE